MKSKKLLGLLFTFSLFGQDCGCPPLLPPLKTDPGFNASSRIEVNHSLNLFANASFIFWEATQSNMELGIVHDRSNPNFFINGNIVRQDFEYKPGFKVALGANIDQDAWDFLLEYTCFHSTVGNKTSLNRVTQEKILFPSWQIPDLLVSYFDGKESWTVNMDLLDLELGRPYFVGSKLSFRPFFGARAAWISQKVNVEYNNAVILFQNRNSVLVIQKSSSWGVGPRAGIGTNWPLGKGFRFYGNGSFDILFTKYPKLKFYQEGKNGNGNTLFGSVVKVTERDDHHLRGHTDLELGLGWGTYVAKNRWYTDLTIGYIYQIFFDQNMFRTFVDDQTLGKADSPHGNLYVHGMTLKSRWDF